MPEVSRQQAIETLEEGRRRLDGLLSGVPHDDLVRPATIGGGEWSAKGEPTVDVLVEALEMNSRILIGVVATTPPDVRAICWRHPVEVRPPADFLPRGALELDR